MFNKSPLENIRKLLLKHGESVAVAESVTCGFLQASFSFVPDTAKFFQGGITAYNLGQKYRHLHVNPIHAQDCNCVSAKVAAEMAVHVCSLFNSEWGISITGYATKVPESGFSLFAYYAIAYNKQVVATDLLQTDTAEGEETQVYFVQQVINRLENVVLKTYSG